jgi:LmbE family N-acetylglucosaminyl deacetylase/regulation of enolase protein 1 (concanavalin A-like superfamily)
VPIPVIKPTSRDTPAGRSRGTRLIVAALATCAVALAAAGPAGAQGAGTIQADDFNGTSLNAGVWTLANPLGDASVSVSGGTADVSLPGGSMHDVWGNTNTSSGLRQAVPDRDFEIEAKFTSVVSSGFQMQGLIVEQDANDLVRAEVHHDGAGTRLFVATMFNGNPEVRHYSTVPDGGPVYIRVVRAGNTWRVRYSRDGSSWTTTDPFSLAIAVTRAGPLVGNSNGPSFTGRVDSFREVLPDTTAPAISGIASAPRTLDATVTWTTDEPATSEVAYGPTTAYGSAKIGDDGLTTGHSVILHGLACGATYHFQVKSKDASNNTATSTDRTLTTAACPTAMQSDEFNAASVDMSRWTLVDPGGGATVSGNGSQALVNLPEGVQHDVWTGSDTVARLLQPAPNDDFELLVKYDSIVSLTYQMQGLLVEQDSNDLLRLEVHREGVETRLFAANIANGVASMLADPINVPDGAPVYLRLRRSGSSWSFAYSQNGTAWIKSISFDRPMTVTAAGLMAGNSGGVPPAFQARADFFRYTPPDRTPPVVTGIAAVPSAGSGARVTWTTDEQSSSEVSFGTTTAYAGGTITGAGDVTSHVVPLHGLQCNTLYHYRVRAVDGSGNATTSTDRTVTSGACPALLQSDEFNGTTLDTTKWAFIDPLNDSSSSLATGAAQIAVPAGTAHDLWSTVRTVPRLLQAAPNADFEVITKFDSAVGTTTQQQGLVVEESHDKLLRFETYYEGPQTKLFVASIDGGTAEILHDSVVPGGAPVYLKLRRLGNRWTFSYSNDGEGWRPTTFDKALNVTAIGPYVGNGGSIKPAFQGRIDYFREITDRTPPVITQVSTRPVSRQAQVTWTTDEPSTTVVEYRPASSTGAFTTQSNSELQTRHSIVASGLACSTSYTFRVRSVDALGNSTTSANASFSTTACTSSGGPDIDVWNGSPQTFGEVGVPQTWVNVAGNVSDPDGIQSLQGRINGGGWETLGFMPDGWRIQRPGDFNYEINQSELVPGTGNYAELRATDAGGRVTTRTVTIDWQGLGGGSAASTTGPVLVVAAHPDDESLNIAGVIDRAKSAGRRVYVTIFTNGEGGGVETPGNYCNAPADATPAAGYGLLRDQEARSAMGVLGLTWSSNLSQTELIFLGYPGRRVPDVASAEVPMTNAQTGIQRTYADDFDGNVATCNGDFRWLLSGQHSQFTASAMRADLDSLLAMTAPSDIYTHSSFDGHPDHAEVAKQLRAAVRRANRPARVHTTLEHPVGDTDCPILSAARWPNPALQNNDPFARFTPWLDFTAPPANPCDPSDNSSSWGPMGGPNEFVDVPTSMQTSTESTNKKWQAISRHASQIDCTNPDEYHVNCGYMRAFVKRREFFWRYDYRNLKVWPKSYTAQWTSNASIAQESQILEGQWRYEGDGVRPLTTGFDRALILGDMNWTDFDMAAPFTIHSFNPTTPQGSAVGLATGWQGHNAWGQPRNGHPGGGLCLYAKQADDTFKLQLGYSPGPVDDTIVTTKEMSLASEVRYMMRFRQQDGFQAGSTRYSCKVWRADQAEPSAWDLQYDIPDWPGVPGQRPGSAVLLAHEVDATFGDTTITPLP